MNQRECIIKKLSKNLFVNVAKYLNFIIWSYVDRLTIHQVKIYFLSKNKNLKKVSIALYPTIIFQQRLLSDEVDEKNKRSNFSNSPWGTWSKISYNYLILIGSISDNAKRQLFYFFSLVFFPFFFICVDKIWVQLIRILY